jgi:hypothetical protein
MGGGKMKTFLEWLDLKEISSNLLARAADAASERGDMKGDRLQPKFLQGADKAAARAGNLPRARSWTSTPVTDDMNQSLIPDHSAIRYFFRGDGGKTEEGSFVVRSIKYNEHYDWFQKERRAAWDRTRGPDGISYSKPTDPSVSGRMPDHRELYVITTTKGEKVTVDGMASESTMWQMGEEPTVKDWDNKLQMKLDGKEIFPDRKGAVEIARQINKFDYDSSKRSRAVQSNSNKSRGALDFRGIKPEYIKQA